MFLHLSVILSTWGAVCPCACWDTSPGRHPPTPPRDGYCCGLYASYWNAFLLHNNSLSVIYTDLPMRSSLSTLQKCTRKQMLNNYCYRAVQWNSLAAGRSGFRPVVFWHGQWSASRKRKSHGPTSRTWSDERRNGQYDGWRRPDAGLFTSVMIKTLDPLAGCVSP